MKNHRVFKSKYIIIYFIALFFLLTLVYYPSFNNPPRSDYWSAFSFFHLVNDSPSPPSRLHILTYDPWSHGTYRPFCAFLLGFNLYISFLKSGNYLLLFPVGLFFLFGMLCYQVFALWPVAIIILIYTPSLLPKYKFKIFL